MPCCVGRRIGLAVNMMMMVDRVCMWFFDENPRVLKRHSLTFGPEHINHHNQLGCVRQVWLIMTVVMVMAGFRAAERERNRCGQEYNAIYHSGPPL